MAALVRQLKVRLPRPGLARHDPWGLRAGVLLMLVIGLVAARQDAGPRLLRAIDPGLGAGRVPPFVELWITPPAYTGVAPMFFTAGGAVPAESGASGTSAAAARPDIRVPRGSVALVRAGGLAAPPCSRLTPVISSSCRSPATLTTSERGVPRP